MKKILFYTDTPMLGGAENQMFLLAKFLPKDKYEVTLACTANKNLTEWTERFKEIGCNVIRINISHKHDPRHLLQAKNLFSNFDLVHIHVWNPASNRYALAIGALLKNSIAPIVITEHDPFSLIGIKKWIKSKLLAGVSKIILPSQGARNIFLADYNKFEDLTTVIPNGIDIEQWKSQVEAARLTSAPRELFQAESSDKIILCVAELNARKGQKYLMEAFELIAPKHPTAKLFFIGDGPARDEYEFVSNNLVHSSVRNKIKFLGRAQHVAPYMAGTDIFVLPSVREAFGLVLLEAAVAKLPIIASDVGGIPEILENEKSALLVPPKNSEALAKALDELLTDKQKSEMLAQNAYTRACDNFPARSMAEKTAEVYDKILST